MQRESTLVRDTSDSREPEYVFYSFEKWFEDYYERPACNADYDINGELIGKLIDVVREEFEEMPILVSNSVGRREWFYEAPRRVIDPVKVANVISNNFDVVMISEGGKALQHINSEKITWKRTNRNTKTLSTEKIKIASYHKRIMKIEGQQPYDSYKFKIHNADDFEQYRNRNILWISSAYAPDTNFLRLWSPLKVLCVYSFQGVMHRD